MDALYDNMLANIPYPGTTKDENGKTTYSLASFVRDKVKSLVNTTDKSISLSTGNFNGDFETGEGNTIPYGYYEATLTIAGATASKIIKVDTLTVESAKTFMDALRYDVNKIILANDIIISDWQEVSSYKIEEINEGRLVIDTKGYVLELPEM